MSLKVAAIKALKWSSLATVITIAVQMIQVAILAFFLTPVDYGIWGALSIFFLFFRQFSDIGIASALIHYQDSTEIQMITTFWLSLIIGFFSYIFFIILIPGIEFLFDANISFHLFVFSITLIFLPVGSFFQTLFQKELNFKLISLIEIIILVATSAVTITLAIAGKGVWALIIGNMALLILKSVSFWILGRKKIKILFVFSIKEIKPFLKFVYYQIGERILNFISFKSDQLIIGSLLGIELLGFYNFAFNIVAKPYTIINPIFTKVAFPILAKVQDQPEKIKSYYFKLVDTIGNINIPLFVMQVLFIPIIFPLLWGDKWEQSIVVAQALSIATLVRSLYNPIGSLILAKGKPELGFKWNLFVSIISLPVIYLATLYGNIICVAFAIMILMITQFPFYKKFLLDKLLGKLDYRYFIPQLKSFFISITVFVIISIVVLQFEELLNQFLISIFGSLLLFVVLIRLFNRSELLKIREFLSL